jgi:hypothetical protein
VGIPVALWLVASTLLMFDLLGQGRDYGLPCGDLGVDGGMHGSHP